MQSRKTRLTGRSPADVIGILLIVLVLGVIFFQSDSYTVDTGSKDVVWIQKSWWGLKQEHREIKWINSAWQTKDKDGNWYPCVVDFDPPQEEYPHTR